MEAATGDKFAQKAEDHYMAASIQQDEHDRRVEAAVEAVNDVITNQDTRKMEALPKHDVKEIVETFEADLAGCKAERISAGHVEASFTPPNVTFKVSLRRRPPGREALRGDSA